MTSRTSSIVSAFCWAILPPVFVLPLTIITCLAYNHDNKGVIAALWRGDVWCWFVAVLISIAFTTSLAGLIYLTAIVLSNKENYCSHCGRSN